MASNDKQTRKLDGYIKRIQEQKKAYQKRKDYLATQTLRKINVAGWVEEILDAVGIGSGNAEEGDVPTNEAPVTSGDGNGIVAAAKTKIGAKYVLGNEGPSTFDCSGLVYWAYKQNGYTFGRGTAHDYYKNWDKVTNPVAGDAISFDADNDGRSEHVGIYIDADTMIHTANPRKNLEIVKMGPYWGKHVVGYRRPPQKYWPKGNGDSAAKSFAEEVTTVSTTSTELIGDPGFYPPIESENESTIFDGRTGTYPYNQLFFRGSSIILPAVSRAQFLQQRIGWGRSTNYSQYEHLDKEQFIHQGHYDGYEGNLYSPDAKRLFESLLSKTQKPYFEVVSGFRFSNKGQLSPHEAGCAIDLLVRDIDEAREIADCAWTLGVQSIAIGGDFNQNKGFIHLDIGPKGDGFSYEGTPIYGGPGKWVIA